MFFEEYKNFMPKNVEEVDKTRQQIHKIVEKKSKDEANKKKPVHEEASVKEVVGNNKVCWGCFSKMCFEKQRMCKKFPWYT